MKRIGSLAGVVLIIAACGGSVEASPTTGTDSPAATAADGPDARTVSVYSSVVRQLVVVDHTFGRAASPFERVYVDVRIEDRGDSDADPPDGDRLTAEEQAAIAAELADLPPVEFVADRDSVIEVEDGCPHVKENGVLITLGQISGDADRVTVPNDMFFACLGGRWLTYVLERAQDDWRITGTTGAIGIS